MTVVIHEFEVVAEPTAPRPADSGPAAEPDTRPAPSAHDVERILRRRRDRAARVWAG